MKQNFSMIFFRASVGLFLITATFIFLTDLVRNLNPNKASGSDGISGQMLLVCDDAVGLISSLYPDMWKFANVTPILKKGDKQSIINYRPISLLPLCENIFEKNISLFLS